MASWVFSGIGSVLLLPLGGGLHLLIALLSRRGGNGSGIPSISPVGIPCHAWRLGNERRAVGLLGVFSGLVGAGTAASAIL